VGKLRCTKRYLKGGINPKIHAMPSNTTRIVSDNFTTQGKLKQDILYAFYTEFSALAMEVNINNMAYFPFRFTSPKRQTISLNP